MAEGKKSDAHRQATRLVRTGRAKDITGPFVNPPVVHASTVLFDTSENLVGRRQRYIYGRRGTPTSEALETALTELENAAGTVLCPSGLSASTAAMMACLNAGDELLVTDSVYQPTRYLADKVLARFGVKTIYYDPLIGAGIGDLITNATGAIYLESPGSTTFEMQDLPAIAAAAKDSRAAIIFDNTWASPLGFKPLDHGADLVVEAGTKYIAGHSDVMIGTVSANAEHWAQLQRTHGAMGLHVAPDDVYLALRGLRTMGLRLERHAQSAMAVATWLQGRPEIATVYFPPLPDDPGHAIWKRDMHGASGLLSIKFDDWAPQRMHDFVNRL
ncbi:MAG: cystathionine beta-lyase, partial [Alphaproteobacteria bacterium]